MRLISTNDALGFLDHSAPRAWVKRMLAWMCVRDELRLYATEGVVTGVASLVSVLADEPGFDVSADMASRDALIQKRWNADFASKMVGKRLDEEIEDDPHQWTINDEPIQLSAGTILFADVIDWEGNTLSGYYFSDTIADNGDIFWDDETVFISSFSKANYRVSLSGLSLELDRIELLQPKNLTLSLNPDSPKARGPLGRPPKWDWEGAMAAMVAAAQHPDGLATGAGAQADLERRLAEWFVKRTGDAPAASLVRIRAARIMELLRTPESR